MDLSVTTRILLAVPRQMSSVRRTPASSVLPRPTASAISMRERGSRSEFNALYAGWYYSPDSPESYEILVRCENMDPGSRYLLFSSFTGSNVLTETFSGQDVEEEITGPYIKQLTIQTEDVTLRQTGSFPPQMSRFVLWREDGEVLQALEAFVFPMEDFGGPVADNEDRTMAGYMTVITSVPYDPGYEIEVDSSAGKLPCETFNYAGRLAAAFDMRAASDVSFRVTSSVMLYVLMIAVRVLSAAGIIYNIVRSRRQDGAKTSC